MKTHNHTQIKEVIALVASGVPVCIAWDLYCEDVDVERKQQIREMGDFE